MLSTITKYTAAIGAVSGLLWGTAFGLSFMIALIIGMLVGMVLGVVTSFIVEAVTERGNIAPEEAMFVVGSHLGIAAWLTVGSGVLAWIIRLVFF